MAFRSARVQANSAIAQRSQGDGVLEHLAHEMNWHDSLDIMTQLTTTVEMKAPPVGGFEGPLLTGLGKDTPAPSVENHVHQAHHDGLVDVKNKFGYKGITWLTQGVGAWLVAVGKGNHRVKERFRGEFTGALDHALVMMWEQ